MKILGLIPARYASTRFPGKPLHPIAGKSLLQRVVERCRMAKSLAEVIVATDDNRIAESIRGYCRVEMTRSDHPSGTDRIAEVAERCGCDGVVNIQGDEPLMDPRVIDRVAEGLMESEMTTAATRITRLEDYDNPNVVKVVCSIRGKALYFSRRTIPCVRDGLTHSLETQLGSFPFLKHLGIYGFRTETLLRLVRYPQSALEMAEKLEQLRALENDIAIHVAIVDYESIGVDLPSDVAKVEAILAASGENA